MKTFMMERRVIGKREEEYFDEFELRGELFVVHHSPWSDDEELYAVSHKETGFGIPRSSGRTIEESKYEASLIINRQNEEYFKRQIDIARNYVAPGAKAVQS